MLMRIRRCYIILTIVLVSLAMFYVVPTYFNYRTTTVPKNDYRRTEFPAVTIEDYNLWLIFTKIYEGSTLQRKFTNLIKNLVNISSVPLNLNIIVDNSSRIIAREIIIKSKVRSRVKLTYNFYDIDFCGEKVEDIKDLMSNYFSKPGSYYSDVLFYISLGLHRIAPKQHKRAILLDCDIFFKKDIALLFDEFNRFKETALFGLAPEQSPVYRHILRLYRLKNNSTTFGDYYHWNEAEYSKSPHPSGFQGYNSGVLLLKLDLIRQSMEYNALLQKTALDELTKKYNFKQGHLGDQDFYTLVGYEYPHLIQTLHCGFNKQLCTWWRDNGYSEVFHHYFRCDHEIVAVHGNCNTEIH